MKICPDVAKLSAGQLREIRAFEKKLGLVIVAYEPVPEIAQLDNEQVESLKQMEKKTGTILVAYKS